MSRNSGTNRRYKVRILSLEETTFACLRAKFCEMLGGLWQSIICAAFLTILDRLRRWARSPQYVHCFLRMKKGVRVADHIHIKIQSQLGDTTSERAFANTAILVATLGCCGCFYLVPGKSMGYDREAFICKELEWPVGISGISRDLGLLHLRVWL